MLRPFHLVALLGAFTLTACADEDDHAHDPQTDESNWTESYRAAELDKADGIGCSGVLLPDNMDFGGRIALTFDDGPRPASTRRVMDVLKKHDAPGAFFMLGKDVAPNRSLVQEMLNDSRYIVASHTWSHANLVNLSLDEVAAQLDRTNAAFAELGHTVKFFRAPYGSLNCARKQLVVDRGMVSTGWHIDSADWAYASGNGRASWDGVPSRFKTDMAGYIESQVTRHNGGVLLFHDTKDFTADQLDAVLTRLKALGFSFVRLDDASVFPQLNGQAPAPQAFVGDPCATDTDCAFTAGGKPGWCLDETLCVIDCAGSCPDKAGEATTFCIADSRPGIEGGVCVSKAGTLNAQCTTTPGLAALDEDRYVGMSTATAAVATVCTLPRATFCDAVSCGEGETCEYGVCGTP
jgi:peptidoglycan/xylan/chitin deacetylase (PgdA/CDA1 family)